MYLKSTLESYFLKLGIQLNVPVSCWETWHFLIFYNFLEINSRRQTCLYILILSNGVDCLTGQHHYFRPCEFCLKTFLVQFHFGKNWNFTSILWTAKYIYVANVIQFNCLIGPQSWSIPSWSYLMVNMFIYLTSAHVGVTPSHTP